MKKNALIIALLAASGFISTSALAADGDITFNGAVKNTTCTIDGNGGTGPDFAVALPMMLTNALNAAGKVAGTESFEITVGGATGTCPDTTKVAITYEPSSPHINAATGNLKNTAGTDPAGNVEIQILDAGNGDAVVDLRTGAATKDVEVTGGTAVMPFKAEYIATGGAATAGIVQSSVEYSVTFP